MCRSFKAAALQESAADAALQSEAIPAANDDASSLVFFFGEFFFARHQTQGVLVFHPPPIPPGRLTLCSGLSSIGLNSGRLTITPFLAGYAVHLKLIEGR